MKIAILSDIHSNLEALEKSFFILSKKKVDEIVCLGDIVGYGANPKECLKLARENIKYIVLGNHDQVACDLTNISDFNRYAAEAALWTHKILSSDEKDFFKNLTYNIFIENLMFVHSSPYKPEKWYYITNVQEATFCFKHFENKICFIGHSHIPEIFSDSDKKSSIHPANIVTEKDYVSYLYSLDKENKYIINVGSVGQPRDLDWRLSFGVFDTENWIYENIRAEYDVDRAASKIYEAKLPRYLGDRLLLGK